MPYSHHNMMRIECVFVSLGLTYVDMAAKKLA